jgi:hypothetical protein
MASTSNNLRGIGSVAGQLVRQVEQGGSTATKAFSQLEDLAANADPHVRRQLSHWLDEHELMNAARYDGDAFATEGLQDRYGGGLNEAEQACLNRIRDASAGHHTRFVVVTDIGRDHDDEVAFLQLMGLHKLGIADIAAVVTNYGNPESVRQRAGLASGLIRDLGLKNVPVAAGSYAGRSVPAQDYEFRASYADGPISKKNGLDLMVETLRRAPPRSITLLLIAGMTDAAQLNEGRYAASRKAA